MDPKLLITLPPKITNEDFFEKKNITFYNQLIRTIPEIETYLYGHQISGGSMVITNLAVSLLELSQNLSSADLPDVNLTSFTSRG